MIILRLDSEAASVAECAQCGKCAEGTRHEITGLFGENRGSEFICFSCIAPRIQWKKTDGGVTIYSPEKLYNERNYA